MDWIDIGINLTNKRFDHDREQVIDSAIEVGVNKLVITGTSVRESQRALLMANERPDTLFSTAGCHPHDAKSLDEDGLAQIDSLANEQQVVAIGECGLDFNRNFSPKEKQIEVFKQQLELAVKVQKPVFLHERDAFDTQYQILKDYLPSLNGAVSHCFTGQQAHLEAYLSLGLSIGITGWICDERRGKALYDIVKFIPDDRLMVETDGPYLTPRNLPKKPKDGRNEPRFLPHIAKTIAEARGQSLQHIAEISYTNSCHFFNLD
ncbi:TatD family hydrolase [Aliikangiella coralliicola]|nr:TatD family hydrolase [Aliikangiella coralliicola]